MKLNYKRTFLVGFAFLSICAFWQLYDGVVPLILKKTFDVPDTLAGGVMALDNVLALFLLPFFGSLSDRCTSRLGKRTPYILAGTLAAVVLMNLLPFFDNRALFVPFIVALGLLLIAMGVYRSPAVALMPDVTPKPLRSRANAVINLMGAIGGAFTLAATMFLVRRDQSGREDYTLLFAAVAALMLCALVVLLLTVRERKLAVTDEADADSQGEEAQRAAQARGFRALTPQTRKSLLLILCSVFFWFMGYNAVSTSFTKYVDQQWGYGIEQAAACLMIAMVSAIVSYLPVGMLTARIGRKRMIQLGVGVLALCFAVCAFFRGFHIGIYVLFALVGASWAMINVNSYPMVVEISKGADIGRFTGYYYAFSMTAQIVTPILSGALLQYVGYWTLLPYAALMVAISFVTISLTRHGDVQTQSNEA